MAALARHRNNWDLMEHRRKMPAVPTPHRVSFNYYKYRDKLEEVERWVRSGEALGCYRTGFIQDIGPYGDVRYFDFSKIETATMCKLKFL